MNATESLEQLLLEAPEKLELLMRAILSMQALIEDISSDLEDKQSQVEEQTARLEIALDELHANVRAQSVKTQEDVSAFAEQFVSFQKAFLESIQTLFSNAHESHAASIVFQEEIDHGRQLIEATGEGIQNYLIQAQEILQSAQTQLEGAIATTEQHVDQLGESIETANSTIDGFIDQLTNAVDANQESLNQAVEGFDHDLDQAETGFSLELQTEVGGFLEAEVDGCVQDIQDLMEETEANIRAALHHVIDRDQEIKSDINQAYGQTSSKVDDLERSATDFDDLVYEIMTTTEQNIQAARDQICP